MPATLIRVMNKLSLMTAVAPPIGKIIKNGLQCFWKRRKFTTKWYITLCL